MLVYERVKDSRDLLQLDFGKETAKSLYSKLRSRRLGKLKMLGGSSPCKLHSTALKNVKEDDKFTKELSETADMSMKSRLSSLNFVKF